MDTIHPRLVFVYTDLQSDPLFRYRAEIWE